MCIGYFREKKEVAVDQGVVCRKQRSSHTGNRLRDKRNNVCNKATNNSGSKYNKYMEHHRRVTGPTTTGGDGIVTYNDRE